MATAGVFQLDATFVICLQMGNLYSVYRAGKFVGFVCLFVCLFVVVFSLSLSLSYYFFLCIPVGGLIPIILYSFSGLRCGQKQLTTW